MLMCKGPCKNWYLQLMTTRFFNQHKKHYDFTNPAWLVVYKDEDNDEEGNPLNQQSDNVISFMDKTGGIVQEIFGLNYNDLMELDRYTYNRIKSATFKICERRAKEQEERDRQEMERLKKAEEAQLAAMRNSK